jgi:hypothetical protein
MAINGTRLALGLAGFQALDGIACAIPVAYIADDLERLGVPAGVCKALPMIKWASALGLVVGLREPRLGRVTSAALVAYFGCALAVHARSHDHPLRYVPAATVGTFAALTGLTAYRRQRSSI